MMVKIMVVVLWVMAPCDFIGGYQYFWGSAPLILKIKVEEEGPSTVLMPTYKMAVSWPKYHSLISKIFHITNALVQIKQDPLKIRMLSKQSVGILQANLGKEWILTDTKKSVYGALGPGMALKNLLNNPLQVTS
jgi:hypothetical protein